MKHNRKPKEFPFKKYQPISNPAAFDSGCVVFETYGKDYQRVKRTNGRKLWTVVDGDNGESLIVAGWHYVNRLHYVITEREWDHESEVYAW